MADIDTDPFDEAGSTAATHHFGDLRSCGWFEWRQSPSRRVIIVAGEVDMSNAGDLASGLEGLGRRQLTVDLRQVTFIDSTGVGALVTLANTIAPRRLGLAIEEGSQVDRLLVVSGLTDLFDVSRH